MSREYSMRRMQIVLSYKISLFNQTMKIFLLWLTIISQSYIVHL